MEVETPSLKYFRDQLEKALYLAQDYAEKANADKNHIYFALHRKNMLLNEKRAQYYAKKMAEHGKGEGVLVLVEGKVWDGKGHEGVVFGREFQMYLQVASLEDAKEVFISQVLTQRPFILDSITYSTIELKTLLL